MLILTRSTGETVRIGDDIKVTVIAVNGRSVKLGIQAPDDIAIHRNEIYLKNLAQQGSGAVDRQE